ncbi:hypothetical protein FOZ63_000959 [Perkinsus olseni]|uniref:Uncharacterized protein n=1 Tax=Perkinsus olseni TaxID=32597 RepID=A0A7J6T9H5_PEROL|nr:hypothetical protein FOZ63_000959 [Perkinsus olseni]
MNATGIPPTAAGLSRSSSSFQLPAEPPLPQTALNLDRLCDKLERIVDKLDLYLMSTNKIVEMAHAVLVDVSAHRTPQRAEPVQQQYVDPQRGPQHSWTAGQEPQNYGAPRVVDDEGRLRETLNESSAGRVEATEMVSQRQHDRAPRKSKIIRKSSRKSLHRLEAPEEAVRGRRPNDANDVVESKRSKSRQAVGESADADGEEARRREVTKVRRPSRVAEEGSDDSDGRSDGGDRGRVDDRKLTLQQFVNTLMRQFPERPTAEASQNGVDRARKTGRRSRRSSASRKQSQVVEVERGVAEDDELAEARRMPASSLSSEDMSD